MQFSSRVEITVCMPEYQVLVPSPLQSRYLLVSRNIVSFSFKSPLTKQPVAGDAAKSRAAAGTSMPTLLPGEFSGRYMNMWNLAKADTRWACRGSVGQEKEFMS